MVFSDTGDLHGGFYDSNAGVDYHVPVRGTQTGPPPLRVVHVSVEMAPIAKVRQFRLISAHGGLVNKAWNTFLCGCLIRKLGRLGFQCAACGSMGAYIRHAVVSSAEVSHLLKHCLSNLSSAKAGYPLQIHNTGDDTMALLGTCACPTDERYRWQTLFRGTAIIRAILALFNYRWVAWGTW